MDPLDESAIAEGLERLLGDAAFRRRLIEKGTKRLEMFSWEASARKHADVLHRAAKRVV